MRTEGRVRGRPTNKTRLTGRNCRRGRKRGRSWDRHRPKEKSKQKSLGWHKRFAADVITNPALAEFAFQPPLKALRGGLVDNEDERRCFSEADDGAVKLGILVATVNSVIEAALAKMHSGYGDDLEMDETTAMACTTFGLGSGGAILAGDGTDIAAIELAIQRQLGIFENAVEGSSFSHFAKRRGSTLSEKSWSDVDLLESDEESAVDDDWSLVDDFADEV